jgi:L-fucose mutarotase/ribose pyranase (RbsD/FucU family)
MKKTMLLGLAVTVLALTSFNTFADNQYPASDFQPQVIYLDKSVAPQAAAPVANEVDAKYPAANFQPTVIYSADSTTVAKASAQPVVDEFDPKYPAANFQPKVIYP